MMAMPMEWNNRAASLVANGDCESAITCLTALLREVKSMIISLDDPMVIADDASSSSHVATCSFDVASMNKSSHFQEIMEQGGNCPGSIFRAPIVLTPSPPREIDRKDEIPYNYEFLSYVILYNLGLAHHMRGMEERDGSVKQGIFLQKAVMLYESAHQLLSREKFNLSLLHDMAIASNLGHIHYILGDADRASLCFQHLLSTMVYVMHCDESNGVASCVMGTFISNVMPFLYRSTSAAAA